MPTGCAAWASSALRYFLGSAVRPRLPQSIEKWYDARTGLRRSRQNGSYLTELLLTKGYRVFGTSRDLQVNSSARGLSDAVRARVEMLSMAPNNYRSVLSAVERASPDEVYALAGQSSAYRSRHP